MRSRASHHRTRPPVADDSGTARRSSRCARDVRRTATSRRSRRVRIRKLRVFALLVGPRPARDRLDRVRDDDGRRLRPAAARGARGAATRSSSTASGERARPADRQPEPDPAHESQIAPVMKHAIIAIEDRASTPTTASTCAASAARCARTSSPSRRSRAARRSRSSSSRTRSPPRTTARCSRSCARPRSPTTSRASGPRSRSCATTSTRSTSATAPTASSRPRAPTSAANHPGCDDRRRAAVRRRSSSRTRRRCSPAWSPRRARYDPSRIPRRRQARRDLVLAAHARAGLHHARSSTTTRDRRAAPDRGATSSRRGRTRKYPYFTSWIKQQVVDQLGGGQTARARRSRAA